MSTSKIQDVVYILAEPVVAAKGLELVGVEYVKVGPNWYLRIYIDKDGGVDHEDCQAVSREVSDLLDREDPIAQPYFLEVSSPGIERILQTEKDFERFRGRRVNVQMYKPFEGMKKTEGVLGTVGRETLDLQLQDGRMLVIPRDKIAQVRLAWEEEGESKKK